MKPEIKKYTKKPVEISAIEWNGDNLFDVITFTDGEPNLKGSVATEKWANYCTLVQVEGLKIHTLEGWMNASIGDMIIKGVKGEHYACKPDIFKLTYDEA